MESDFQSTTLPRPIQLLPLIVLLFAVLIGSLAIRKLELIPSVKAPSPGAAPDASRTGAAAVLPRVFTPSVQHWAFSIETWAADFELDPNLVATVMQIESCGDPGAVSPSGAQGLFQVMPFHFAADETMLDPDTNARRGLQYLAQGLALADGDVRLALAGYNGGHSQIGKNPAYWPAETQRYVRWGASIYSEVTGGQEASPTLTAWLAAGGESLCAQAGQRLGL